MPQTHDIGRLFLHTFRYPLKGAPLIDRAKAVEVEPPYRVGRGVTLRWGPRRALVIGRWGLETRDEGEALYDALKARDLDEDVKTVKGWRAPESEDEECPTASAF
jgi:hypothetical protein